MTASCVFLLIVSSPLAHPGCDVSPMVVAPSVITPLLVAQYRLVRKSRSASAIRTASCGQPPYGSDPLTALTPRREYCAGLCKVAVDMCNRTSILCQSLPPICQTVFLLQ